MFSQTSKDRDNKERLDEVDKYVDTGTSCPELCAKYDVDIREFVILACMSETGESCVNYLSAAIGLSPTTVSACIDRLFENGLIRSSDENPPRYLPTTDGIAMLRKAGE